MVVAAVRLDIETEGFTYRKWGALQRCNQGDWLVDNNGDVYTVSGAVFARTYRQVSRGLFMKVTPVWAEVACVPGSVKTKEGSTFYATGDYLVFNDEDGMDHYAISKETFESLYMLDD